uniref:Protein MEMO1 n=1 Tax=Phallusia mammillata TaxID=59560 RepID=A0A6F9DLG3_9ASCI|nr:protein MEMO1 [Phallusia mammillata]
MEIETKIFPEFIVSYNFFCVVWKAANPAMTKRKASHAGSWYLGSGSQLNKQLGQWLEDASTSNHGPAKVIISPHAGYTYCGSCAAHAYKQINSAQVQRVFILGPSHHVYLQDCALSSAKTYKTPLYDLAIDQSICEELYSTGKFQTMSMQTDEDEHSIEMQLPFIAKVMERKQGSFTIIPVLVGSLKQETEQEYGRLFSKYLKDPCNVFVISSDFCHWGRRFRYIHYEPEHGEIHKSIEALDKQGMKLIEALDPEGFYSYLQKYKNTICGRHPIAVMLNAVKTLLSSNGIQLQFKFLDYKQSSKCQDDSDSSVSYAAGSLVVL